MRIPECLVHCGNSLALAFRPRRGKEARAKLIAAHVKPASSSFLIVQAQAVQILSVIKVHGSLNVPIEHHPTIRYMVYNGYYKVMSNIPKMGQLPTPENNQQNLGFLSWENLNLKISPKLWRLQERPGKAQSPRCNSRK